MPNKACRNYAALAPLAGLIAFGVGAPAPAQPPSVLVQGERLTQVHRIVRYGDLNLADERGRDKLVKRVRDMIDDMCDEHDDLFVVLGRPDRECVSSGWASAQPQLDQALSRAGTSLAAASIVISVRK